MLWTAVGVVIAGIIVIILLCVKGRSGDTKPHPSEDLQITAITRRPRGDSRRYQHTVLPNGLQVVNVEDSSSKTSAYSMAVQAGSFDDPENLPGLAHFCEHMLFLGTQSYPGASSYDDFVSSNGGSLNAYTAEETTVYYTEVSAKATGEGLRRFADFFRAPLFAEQYVEREVHAIDSEHGKNVQDPVWRVNQLMNSMADKASPVAAFHTGNLETLYDTPREAGIDPVASLRSWYEEHYCPSRYRLVTYGPDPLDKQLEMVYEDFTTIPTGSPSCRATRRSWGEPAAWTENTTGHWATIEGMQPQSELLVFFPLPDISKEYLSQPLQYIEYAIMYGGENSFVKTLRDTLGLASSVSVSADSTSAGTSVYFSCRLTQAGREHPGLVLDLLFQYLHMLQHRGIDKDLYFSLANVSQLNWDWAQATSPADTVADLAERMTRLPLTRILSGDEIIEEPKPSLVARLIEKLTPQRMNVGLVDPEASDHLFRQRQVRTAPYYGTKYTLVAVDEEVPGAIERWEAWQAMNETEVAEQVAELLAAANVSSATRTPAVAPLPVPPGPVSGVTTDFSLDHMTAGKALNSSDYDEQLFGPRPASIQDLQEELEGDALTFQEAEPPPGAADRRPKRKESLEPWKPHKGKHQVSGPSMRKAWCRSGWVNPSPKVQMQFVLRPRFHPEEVDVMDALSGLRLGFYSSLLAEELVPKLYDRAVAGSSFDVSFNLEGGGGVLSMSFEGFPPLLPPLIHEVVKEFDKGVKVEDHMSRFKRIYEEFGETFKDYSNMPVDYALSDRNILLTPGMHSKDESLAALENVTAGNVASAPDQLVKSRPLDLSALIMGNIGTEEAEDAVDWVMEGLHGVQSVMGSHQGEVRHSPPIVNPSRPVEVRKRNPREGDANDAVVISLIVGVATVESRVILGLVGQILSVLAYSYLRTDRQLGYVVNAGIGQMSNVQYVSTIIQGQTVRADAMELDAERVYFKLMPQRLRNLTDAEFKTYKDSFRQQLLQPPVGRSEEFNHYWSHIMNGGRCFGLLNEMLEFMDRDLTSKTALVEAWDQIIFASSDMSRKKVTVKYFAGKVPPRPEFHKIDGELIKAGFSMEARERLSMEFGRTKVLDTVNSTVRRAIAKEGGHFPSTLNCRRQPPKHKAKRLEAFNEKRKQRRTYPEDSQTRRDSLPQHSPTIVQLRSARGHQEGRHFLQPAA